MNRLEHRIAGLEKKRGRSRCGECVGKPCPKDLNCPLVFFDQLVQEAERRRQEGDTDFVRMAAKALGII